MRRFKRHFREHSNYCFRISKLSILETFGEIVEKPMENDALKKSLKQTMLKVFLLLKSCFQLKCPTFAKMRVRKYFMFLRSSRKYYYYRRPICHRRPTWLIGDRHVWLETHWRPTCLIGDPSETNMPHRRPTCPIRDQHASSETP